MSFDFSAAVSAPFRMQPGLRRMAPGSGHLTPLLPGSRHQREKLAVLSAYWPQALLTRPGFDPTPALVATCEQAAAEHPQAWDWDGQRAHARWLGTATDWAGVVEQTASGQFGLGDEVARCLEGLPAPWRLTGLLSLAFAEDLAVVDGQDGTIPWLAVALPSHWAPQDKIGRAFDQVHAPVADGALLRQSAPALTALVTRAEEAGSPRWERFVWNITDHPRLHAHPARVDHRRWATTPVENAWFRTERQTFLPVPGQGQAVFTIEVQVGPLAAVTAVPEHARALHDAVATMSPAVLDYRGLTTVREPLLAHLHRQAQASGSRP